MKIEVGQCEMNCWGEIFMTIALGFEGGRDFFGDNDYHTEDVAEIVIKCSRCGKKFKLLTETEEK